jgi:hypothetical protein
MLVRKSPQAARVDAKRARDTLPAAERHSATRGDETAELDLFIAGLEAEPVTVRSTDPEIRRRTRERLRRSVPLAAGVNEALLQQPQFCLPMPKLLELLRARQPAGTADLESRLRAVVAWGVSAGLFFHDPRGDVVHLGLCDF